ncbi:hypothetical protein ABFS82_07G087700 [Erythranthe guttata]|uniref:Uncharacterized protein n=1 Tax=Erythranthe guttata TaxID=4155 RepID=A0A022RBI6_ERYGU|nr:PREDICTED: uncharacterized protein LOC105958036 [Erythranthe guttata]EYU37374.1 hypothetical protein MIMGU_mgv1a010917mg [Erythranthe guttata]|eukprot:XP_012837491.1 PREDICTED: uncharacterized protein LOC105958036 [Erythranthe guttata]
MEAAKLELEETLMVFEASLSHIKWRLKPSSKSRLQTDILALCSSMRPCIMVDYGGKMPELGHRLCAFLTHCKKVSSIFELLHVMVIDEMIYLINARTLADFVKSSLTMETTMLFVDLENDPPKLMTRAEKSHATTQLLSAQNLFSSVFHADGIISDHLLRHDSGPHSAGDAESLVDLSCCLKECEVTIPSLNGWLLGYPVIYLFGKDYIERAVCNLSTKSLHIYQFFVDRVDKSSKGHQKEELMSFTVPYDLSMEGSSEAWAKSFFAEMQVKWDKCKHIWGSLHMEVNACYPQAIAL